VLRTIEIAAEKAGLKDVGVRMLRHRAAVMWLEAGAHIKAVADLLGHSSIAITGAAKRHFQADLQILTTRRCGGFNKDEALPGKRMLNPFSDASHIDPPLTSKFGR